MNYFNLTFLIQCIFYIIEILLKTTELCENTDPQLQSEVKK